MGKEFVSPIRLELLDLLAQAPRSVEESARASGRSATNTSRHLPVPYAAGMVARTRDGTHACYKLAGEEALALWLALRDASVVCPAEVERAAREALREYGARSRLTSSSAALQSCHPTARSWPAVAALFCRTHRPAPQGRLARMAA
jgi:DNA-binding transcriptional ArsR family regulator